MINKTEAYLKEEEKESLENNDVRKEDKMYGVESWRFLGVCGERTFFLKEQDVGSGEDSRSSADNRRNGSKIERTDLRWPLGVVVRGSPKAVYSRSLAGTVNVALNLAPDYLGLHGVRRLRCWHFLNI